MVQQTIVSFIVLANVIGLLHFALTVSNKFVYALVGLTIVLANVEKLI